MTVRPEEPGDEFTAVGTAGITTSSSTPPGAVQALFERRYLLVFLGNSSWMHQLPSSGQLVIGRSQSADLRIPDPQVSRQHASVTVEGGVVRIRDLGSQNGTTVNGKVITAEQVLASGDVIGMHSATLMFHTSAGAGAASLIDHVRLRQRVEDELDRAVRYDRAFSVLCVAFLAAPDRRVIEPIVAALLRRIDAFGWSGASELMVVLPESTAEDVATIAARLRGRLDNLELRIGHATCPADGCDVDALLVGARNAATGAATGAIAGVERAYQTMVFGHHRVLVADSAMVRLYALIERLAPVDLPVLIHGETGSGKELAATAIHARSARAERRLVSLNCAALTESLVESELFGHEKGAFTGATSAKPGLIEAAHQSTLFLDEIGELGLAIQAKLLRILETKRVMRVGDVEEREVDVRIVAATNRDLAHEVAAGRFRQDLYFRLSAAILRVPPLRERPRELMVLAQEFLEEACVRANRASLGISDEAREALRAYGWPGNVRELKNLMQYFAATCPTPVLRAEDLAERLAGSRQERRTSESAPLGSPESFRPLADEVRELEIARIRAALEATGGNQTRAAALLSIPLRTFFDKVKAYGLSPRTKKP